MLSVVMLCRDLFINILNVIRLSVVMLIVVMLIVVMLIVVMLNVVKPNRGEGSVQLTSSLR
jgi:hypothetical protein